MQNNSFYFFWIPLLKVMHYRVALFAGFTFCGFCGLYLTRKSKVQQKINTSKIKKRKKLLPLIWLKMAFITISYIAVKNFVYFEICIEKKQSELAINKTSPRHKKRTQSSQSKGHVKLALTGHPKGHHFLRPPGCHIFSNRFQWLYPGCRRFSCAVSGVGHVSIYRDRRSAGYKTDNMYFPVPYSPLNISKAVACSQQKMPTGLSFRTHAPTLVAFVPKNHRRCEMLRVDHASSFTV